MKKLLTFLMMSILTIGVGWAATTTVTASKVSSSSVTWTGSGGETWNVTVNGGATNQSFYATGYAQIGTTKDPSTSVTLSTSDISGTITGIVIDCASYQGKATVSATVGGNFFGTQNQSTPSWSSNQTGGEVTFSGSASGAIEITMTNASDGRAMYIKSVTITYSNTVSSVVAPTFSLVAGTYTGTQNVAISSTTEGAIIYYTLDGNAPDPQTSESIANGGSVTISESCTLKAIAVASGVSSTVSSAIYTILQPCTIPFIETWAETEGTGGNDGTWSGSIASGTVKADKSGWTYVKESGADKCVKLGTSSVKGSATTPPLAVINGTKYTLTFKAAAWSGDATQLNLSAAGANLYSDEACSTELSSVTLEDAAFSDYTVYLKATSTTMTITWQGLQDSKARFFLDEVNIVEAGTTPPPTVVAPVITLDPAEGPYYEGSSVTATIACATEGATISYSIDGTNWSNYTQALTITETTTIQAKATLNNVESSIATKTVTFVEAPTTVADIAGFIALDANKEFTFTGDVVVTYVNSTNSNYVWVKDDSGSALFYELGLTPAPAQGDIIKGGWSGKKTVYEGLREITNVTGATIEGSATVTPAELVLGDVISGKQATYGWLRGVTITSKDGRNFTINDGTTTVNGYNTYYKDSSIEVPEANDGKTYDILGVVNVHGDAQFTPVQFVAEPDPDYYLVGSFNMDGNNWIQQDPNYKFTLNDDGKYVLNGVTCPDNVQFKILKVKGSQIIWCGGPADGEVYGIHGGWYKDIPLTIDGGKNYKIDAAGTFNFTMTIDANNSSNNKFTVIKSPVVIKGSFDEWSATGVEMTVTDTGWTTTQQLEANAEFGFSDGWGNWHGGNGKLIVSDDLNTPLTMSADGNFKMEATGNYTLTVNRDLTTFVATKILIPHNIVVDSDIENGTIEIKDNKTTAVAGETVTIVVTPDEGYVLENVTVMAGETAVEVNDLQFVMPDADVTVTASFKENPIVEVMFDYRTGAEFAQENASDMETSVKNGISIIYDSGTNTQNSPKWYSSTSGNARVYVNNTITIDGGENYIEKVLFSFEGSNSLSDPTTNVGTYSNGTWTLGNNNGVLTVDKTARIAYIVVYVDKDKQVVSAPVISGETPFIGSTEVTITCETEDATIYYTINGTDPSNESTPYLEPFTLTESATVKAVAYSTSGVASAIASKTFEKTLSVSTIDEYKALDEGAEFVFTGNVTVTYVNGRYLYVKDETGSALIYGDYGTTFEFTKGQILAPNWTAKTKVYNGLLEAESPANLEATDQTVEVTPVEKAITAITTDNDNEYIIVKNVSITEDNNKNFDITDAENHTIVGRTNFSDVSHPTNLEVKYDITCVVAEFNGTVQLYPTHYEEVIEPVVLEGVTFTADRQWATWYGEDDLALPANVTAYVVTGINTAGTAVEVESVDYIPANTGVLLYSTTAAESIQAVPTEAGESVTSLLQGGPKEVNNAYVLYNNQFILAQDGTQVGAHRCYLPASANTQGAPILRIGEPGTITGIEDLRYDSNGKPVGYYDLTGRYVGTSLNGKRGIFITSDGKKVVR